MDIRIQINDLIVSEISASSGIFSGDNRHVGWSAASKTNTGLNLGGDASLSKDCVNMVYDPDMTEGLKGSGDWMKYVTGRVKQP